jgi:hypothetical protein
LTDPWKEFVRRRDGVCFALDGGVWFHRWRLRGHLMVHLVSADRERLLAVGATLGFHPDWLQYKPLKDPRSGARVAAWHWDVLGEQLKKLGL